MPAWPDEKTEGAVINLKKRSLEEQIFELQLKVNDLEMWKANVLSTLVKYLKKAGEVK